MSLKAKANREGRLLRMGQEFQAALDRKSTPFLRKWLKRNLARWRRLVRNTPPFQTEFADHH